MHDDPTTPDPTKTEGRPVITGLQMRTARKMLNWPPDRLAKRARVAVGLIVQAELHDRTSLIPPHVARTLRHILEDAGLEFCDDPLAPVRWRSHGTAAMR